MSLIYAVVVVYSVVVVEHTIYDRISKSKCVKMNLHKIFIYDKNQTHLIAEHLLEKWAAKTLWMQRGFAVKNLYATAMQS